MMENLKKLRIDKNMSQKDLGKEINISGSSISNYEVGGNYPDIPVLKEMAKYFNVSIEYLLDLTDVPYPLDEAHKYVLCESDAQLLQYMSKIPPDERKPFIELVRNYSRRMEERLKR